MPPQKYVKRLDLPGATRTWQVALRWVTQQGVVAVTASTKASHLRGDLGIFDFTLTDDEMASLTKI